MTKNEGSGSIVSNIKAYINSADESQFVVSYDYTITDTHQASAFNPPDGDSFNITGTTLTPGTGTIAYIIPIVKMVSQQEITTYLTVSATNRYRVYIKLNGSVGDVKKAAIPAGAVITQ